MRVSSNSFTDQFVSQVSQLQQQEIALQGEASTGLAVSSPSDNPSVMDEVLNYQTQASENQQYQANITQLQAAAVNSGTAIGNLQTYSSQAETLAEEAVNSTDKSNYTDLATQIGSLIQQAGRGRELYFWRDQQLHASVCRHDEFERSCNRGDV
jgi:flagellar hook-associated protein 3 FlgL